MKKIILVLFVFVLGFSGRSQSNVYVNLRKLIHEQHPELQLHDKLIAFNVWGMADTESRETNKSLEKTYNVFQVAKLKGGAEGILVVLINTDNLSPEATITLTKDGITKILSVKQEDVQFLKAGAVKNMVFDSSGKEVYRNLDASQVFPSINKLITR